MKKVVSLLLAIMLVTCITTPYLAAEQTDIRETGEDSLWFVDESEKSENRLKYERLLMEDLTGSDVRERFNQLFGDDITNEYLLNHYADVFDTPAEEVDEGLLALLTVESRELEEISGNAGLEFVEDEP